MITKEDARRLEQLERIEGWKELLQSEECAAPQELLKAEVGRVVAIYRQYSGNTVIPKTRKLLCISDSRSLPKVAICLANSGLIVPSQLCSQDRNFNKLAHMLEEQDCGIVYLHLPLLSEASPSLRPVVRTALTRCRPQTLLFVSARSAPEAEPMDEWSKLPPSILAKWRVDIRLFVHLLSERTKIRTHVFWKP